MTALSVVLNGGWFLPHLPTLGDIRHRLETFLVVITGNGGGIGMWWGKARDAAKCLTMNRAASNHPAQNVSSAALGNKEKNRPAALNSYKPLPFISFTNGKSEAYTAR